MTGRLERRASPVDHLVLTGRFGGEVVAEVVRIVTADGGPSILDLGGVDFVTSSAIGCLVHLGVDHGLILAGPGEVVRRALELAEVVDLLTLSATVAEAAGLLAEGSAR